MDKSVDKNAMRGALLEWYDAQGRTLPWRIRPEDRARGVAADPYAIWLSEVMSQQTTIAHAAPYWLRFLAAFPIVDDLANAEREQVMSMWAGLGYYARARNLYKCAQTVRDEFGGVFPKDEAGLLALPGIGPYTAATIAAICYGEATNIVDGNVERVISRIFRVDEPLPKGRKALRAAAGTLVGQDRPGDYGQALMDLGATICTPRNPDCDACPWAAFCAARAGGVQTDYPKKLAKKKTPIRYGAAFVLLCEGRVLLEARPDKGLLGGMIGVPTTAWEDAMPADIMAAAPAPRNWEKRGQIKHVFTHFELRLDVYAAETSEAGERLWVLRADLGDHGIPTVFTKVLDAAFSQ